LYNDSASPALGVYIGGAFQFLIDYTGNVGIGTPPSTRLHIHSSGATYLRVSTSTFTTGMDVGFSASHAYIWNNQNTNLVFATNAAERMTIDNGGKVTINGTPDPNWQFNVLGGGGQLSLNPGSGGTTNYISSYIGANTPGPLALFGSKVFVAADTFGIDTARTPASASAAGVKGDICWDTSYIYVAVNTNSWKRAALSSW
jgi:hypothetical protein